MAHRDTPRRILSLASDPQPEPEPDDEVFKQVAEIDEGLWAWDFSLRDANGVEFASVNRTFRGLGREVRQQLLLLTPTLYNEQPVLTLCARFSQTRASTLLTSALRLSIRYVRTGRLLRSGR